MLRREFKNHAYAYTILVIGLVITTIAYFFAWPKVEMQRLVIFSVSLFYFLWGIVTHVHKSFLTISVVLEYAAVAFLGGAMLFILTL